MLGRSRNHVDEYMNMAPWTKVVTNPLGLAGFALFLVFGYLAKIKRNDERRWLSPVAFAIAAVALARIIREYAASRGWRREVAVKMLVAL